MGWPHAPGLPRLVRPLLLLISLLAGRRLIVVLLCRGNSQNRDTYEHVACKFAAGVNPAAGQQQGQWNGR